jgi:hypothetical protein
MLLGCHDPGIRQCGTFRFAGSTDQNNTGQAGLFQEYFTYDSSKCGCSCNKIWFVQMLRPMDVNGGAIIQPNGTQQTRMVKSSDKAMNGWAIDRPEHFQLGFYHLDDNGHIIQTNAPGEEFRFGDASTDAAMHDVVSRGPGSQWWGRSMLVQGVTAAVCMDSGCGWRVLGMEEWIVNFNSDNTVSIPTAHEALAWEQTALILAVQYWNEHLADGRKELPAFVF